MVELTQFDGELKEELAMVDVARAILENSGEVTEFNDLLAEVAEYLELEDAKLESQMAQFYTDLNIDGRFISLGGNRWGLRGWYPVDSIDEELTHDNDEEDEKPRGVDGFDDYEEAVEEEYKEDLEELEDEEDGDELEGLSVVDDEDVLEEDEEEE